MKMCQLSKGPPSHLHKSQIAASFLAWRGINHPLPPSPPLPGQTRESSSSLVQPQRRINSTPDARAGTPTASLRPLWSIQTKGLLGRINENHRRHEECSTKTCTLIGTCSCRSLSISTMVICPFGHGKPLTSLPPRPPRIPSEERVMESRNHDQDE